MDKKKYIDALLISKEITDSHHGEKNDGYFSFVTGMGIIVGKVVNAKTFDFKDLESIENSLLEGLKEGFTTFDLANSFYMREEAPKEAQCIILEDVNLYTLNSSNLNTFSHMSLFTDQIISVIPGRVRLT